MRVLFAPSFVVNSMDVLAEEFGNLTPEQLAAPIPTVEVRAGHAWNGREAGMRPREALPRELWPRRGTGRVFRACSGLRACLGLRASPLQSRPLLCVQGQAEGRCQPPRRPSGSAHGFRVGRIPVFVCYQGGTDSRPPWGDVLHL